MIGIGAGRTVNCGHSTIRCLSSKMVILLEGSHSKMRLKIMSNSKEMGRMVLKKFLSFR